MTARRRVGEPLIWDVGDLLLIGEDGGGPIAPPRGRNGSKQTPKPEVARPARPPAKTHAMTDAEKIELLESSNRILEGYVNQLEARVAGMEAGPGGEVDRLLVHLIDRAETLEQQSAAAREGAARLSAEAAELDSRASTLRVTIDVLNWAIVE